MFSLGHVGGGSIYGRGVWSTLLVTYYVVIDEVTADFGANGSLGKKIGYGLLIAFCLTAVVICIAFICYTQRCCGDLCRRRRNSFTPDYHPDEKSHIGDEMSPPRRPMLLSALSYQLGSSFDGNHDVFTLAVDEHGGPKGKWKQIRRMFSPSSFASLPPVFPSLLSVRHDSEQYLTSNPSIFSEEETFSEAETPCCECECKIVAISTPPPPYFIGDSREDIGGKDVGLPRSCDCGKDDEPVGEKRRHRSMSV